MSTEKNEAISHMPKFVSGLKLSGLYFERCVKPIIKSKLPFLRYSAGLIGSGSEVLGYDDSQSRDHNWGPRLIIFLRESEFDKRAAIDTELRNNLPHEFLGYSTNFGKPDERGVRLLKRSKSAEVNHFIVFSTVRSFFKEYIGIDPYQKLERLSWLSLPQQKLLTLIKGKIFHDDLGLNKTIRMFEYYPRDVWLFLLASQWEKISQYEAFVARAAVVGDDLGSRILATRIVRYLMELCFLMEKKYASYSKWFGTAFAELRIAGELSPILTKILSSPSIKDSEKLLGNAYSIVAKKHNSLKMTKLMDTQVSKYYDRPYLIIHADAFAKEIRKGIRDPILRRVPLIGSVDQLIDNEDVTLHTDICGNLGLLFSRVSTC